MSDYADDAVDAEFEDYLNEKIPLDDELFEDQPDAYGRFETDCRQHTVREKRKRSKKG